MKLFAKVLLVALCLGSFAQAQAFDDGSVDGGFIGGPGRGEDRGGWDRGGRGGGWDRGGRGGGWEFFEEVHFYDGNTTRAIRKCEISRERDDRCTRSNEHHCSTCSRIDHSDHSSYVVSVRGGRRGPSRRFIDSFHFYDKQTAVAYKKCQVERERMRECNDRRYECSPCTVESHTDHSQFDLYEISRF